MVVCRAAPVRNPLPSPRVADSADDDDVVVVVVVGGGSGDG